jgi:hypothetical protein
MNTNTRLRLWKEARALLPMWAGAAGLMIAPFLVASRGNQLALAMIGFVFGCTVLGATGVGHEFQHRNMAGLLGQPVSRRRIWWEKLTASTVAFSLLIILLLFLACIELWHSGLGQSLRHGAMQFKTREPDSLTNGLVQYIASCHMTIGQWSLLALHYLTRHIGLETVSSFAWQNLKWTPEYCAVLALFLGPPVLGFCTGPTLTLLTRSSLGGAALTFLCPWLLMVVGVLLLKALGGGISGPDESVLLLYYALFAGILYAGAMFLYGCRRFQKFEDVSLLAQEFAAPRQFNSLFAGLTSGLAPGRDSLMANLLRKELRLQRPAFFVAAFIIALWLAFIGVRSVRPEVETAILMGPAVLLCLGIPVIAGIVSTAEERSLGLLDWHLTLPVSARRQWFVKVLVAFGVNLVLGILLPGVLAHASSWLAADKQMVAGIPGEGVPHFLVANLVIFCAALYASTAAANSMRALIGTIVLFLVGAMVMNLGIKTSWVAHSWAHRNWPIDFDNGWWPAPEVVQWGYEVFAPLGWLGLVGWLGALGLANFRRTMEAGWCSARRLVALFAASGLFLGTLFTYQTLISTYHQDFYVTNGTVIWDSQRRAKQRAVAREQLEFVPAAKAPPPNAKPAEPRN